MKQLKAMMPFLVLLVLSIAFTLVYNSVTVEETVETADGRKITRRRGKSDELKKLFKKDEK